MKEPSDALLRLSGSAITGSSAAAIRLAEPRNAALMRLVALRRTDVASALRVYGRKGVLMRLAIAPAPTAATMAPELENIVEN